MISRPIAYRERWSRAGWDFIFSQAGGSLRAFDPIEELDERHRIGARRVTSQAAFAVTESGARKVDDDDVLHWVAVCRKILQRGFRPPVSARIEALLLEAAGVDVDSLHHSGDGVWVARALAGKLDPVSLAPSYELDPTYEAPLWQALNEQTPGLARWIFPQVPLEAIASSSADRHASSRWVDFLYAPPWRQPAAVIEIDGEHKRLTVVDDERDKALARARLPVRRFRGRDALDLEGALLGGMRTEWQRNLGPSHVPEPRPADLMLVHGPAIPARIGLAIVEAVFKGLLPKGGPWHLEITDETLGVAPDLVGPSLDLLWAISDVWKTNVVPSEVVVNRRRWHLSTGSSRPTGDAGKVQLNIRLEPLRAYFEELPPHDEVPQVVVRSVGVPIDLAWLPVGGDRRIVPRSADVERSLRLIVSDLFGHESWRDGQYPAIRQALSGGDSVVLLPTGSGKTLIYQTAALLAPGTTLVVDPLVSLIDDQERRFVKDGIDRVAALHQARLKDSTVRDAALDSVGSGDSLVAFVTPERLQSRRFREHLARASYDGMVNAIVVDEAHCVSEWGHDFRASYLHLARTSRRSCTGRHPAPPTLIALTGTASPAVLRDALCELEIDGDDEGALQRPSSHDRPNLRFEVVVTRSDGQWMELVRRAWLARVPSTLGLPTSALTVLDGARTLSGIVFTPHAGGGHGVEAVRKGLAQSIRDVNLEIETGIYAGQDTGEGSSEEWSRKKAETARRFIENEIALLVATKAFGMGIDKPNIRYTIHAGLPSSIEAFAQEAGRAGRDGQPSVCILTAALPDRETIDSLLSLDITPLERTARLRQIGARAADIERQLYFLDNSFPGAKAEVDEGIALMGELVAKGALPGGSITLFHDLRRAADPKERRRVEARRRARDRALFRLAAIGVVSDITIDGTELVVTLASYDGRSIAVAFLEYASRVEPGREQAHHAIEAAAPNAVGERITHFLRAIVELVYRIVYRSRVYALAAIARLADSEPDPETIRTIINGYLGSGPVASVLSEAVRGSVDVPRFIASMEIIPASDQEELVGQAARQLEAYPDHPLLLIAGALGEARMPSGDERTFVAALQRSVRQLQDYSVSAEDAANAMRWMIRTLRDEHERRRWSWVRHVFDAWGQSSYPPDMLEPVEDVILDEATRGRYEVGELHAVARARTLRSSQASVEMAARLVGATTVDRESR